MARDPGFSKATFVSASETVGGPSVRSLQGGGFYEKGGVSTTPRFTGLRCLYGGFSIRFFAVQTLKLR